MIKPSLEKITPGFGSSFFVDKIVRHPEGKRTHWHLHPEFEIVYVSHGKGKRHIGQKVSHYKEGDLIFIGPNLPHYGFDHDLDQPHTEIVIQMKPEFLTGPFMKLPEFEGFEELFERARGGLAFSKETKWEISTRIESLPELEPLDRLLTLLKVLQIMAKAKDTLALNATGITLELMAQDHQRMEAVYHYARQNFRRQITLEEIADLANMTVPSFCRYFKKITQTTFTKFVNEFRIEYACRLLRGEELTIYEVCLESGFNNVSHFNKTFREVTGESPSQYRKNQVWLVGNEENVLMEKEP